MPIGPEQYRFVGVNTGELSASAAHFSLLPPAVHCIGIIISSSNYTYLKSIYVISYLFLYARQNGRNGHCTGSLLYYELNQCEVSPLCLDGPDTAQAEDDASSTVSNFQGIVNTSLICEPLLGRGTFASGDTFSPEYLTGPSNSLLMFLI